MKKCPVHRGIAILLVLAASLWAIHTNAVAPGQNKPVLIGLVTMGDESWLQETNQLPQNLLREANAHPGVYSAAVIQAAWSQIEPQQNVFDDSTISNTLNVIKTYNAEYPSTPLVGKLRVFAGIHCPSWVLQQVGSFTFTNYTTNYQVTAGVITTNVYTNINLVPDFWTTNYSVLWEGMQNHLAGIYDTNPLMGEVAISVGSSITAEPFVIPGAAVPEMVAAGFTYGQMAFCLSNAPSVYAAWKQTPLDYTFNPTLNAGVGESPPFSVQVMTAFRQALGTRAVLANHDLDYPAFSTEAGDYAEFRALYSAALNADPPVLSPLEFQTSGPTVDWNAVVPFAVDVYHPTEIEIWNTTAVPKGLAPVSLGQLQQWAMMLKSRLVCLGTGSGNPFPMVYLGVLGSNYTLQASVDLTHWTTLLNFTCTNQPMKLLDAQSGGNSQRFYRILP